MRGALKFSIFQEFEASEYVSVNKCVQNDFWKSAFETLLDHLRYFVGDLQLGSIRVIM